MTTMPLLLMGLLGVSPDAPVPVILDTDIADDIDDTWALGMLLGMPEVDLKLVTTAVGNTPMRARLTAKFLERVGRTDIPIGIGLKDGEGEGTQAKWLGDYQLADYPGVIHEDGVQALIDTIHASEKPITLLVIGPMMNIKAALERDPSIASKARVVSMAGSVDVGYNGKEPPDAEYNVRRDPGAVQAVFAAGWDIVMTPVDTCGSLRIKGDDYTNLTKSTAPRAKAVIENYNVWTPGDKAGAPDASSTLFDCVAAYLVIGESYFEMEDIKLSVDDEGYTRRDPNGRVVRCAMKWKDEPGFEQYVIRCLTHP